MLSLIRTQLRSTPRLLRSVHSTSTSTPPPPLVYTPLDNRSILKLSGQDSTKFLQGLVSNDVTRLKRDSLIYCALLQADGRYMSDLFIHRPVSLQPSQEKEPLYYIDHPTIQTTQLRQYLKRHVLRSKLKLGKDVERGLEIVQAWRNPRFTGDRQAIEEAEMYLEERGVGRDPRFVAMGWRWVREKEEENAESQLPSGLFQPTTISHYHLHRLTHSIPENPTDFPALPLEANLDLMNGVDYKKGCYVGQELTARTKHKGVVRKRGVTFRLFRDGEEPPTSLLAGPLSGLIPSPNLFPLPSSGSTLTLLPSQSSSSTNTPTKRIRTPRPSGKLGDSLPLIHSKTGTTSCLSFGSIKLDAIEDEGAIFVVNPPTTTATTNEKDLVTVKEGQVRPSSPDEATAEDEKRIARETTPDEGGSDDMEGGGRWLAKAFMSEWVEFRLEEEAIQKGL